MDMASITRYLTLKTVFMVFLVVTELTAFIIATVALAECKQCVLFGQVFEVKRILVGGPIICCWFIITNAFISVLIAAYVLKCRLVNNNSPPSSSRSTSPNFQMLAYITISNIVSLSVVLMGWYQFCNSFQFVRCHLTSNLSLMDWKTYRPKYSDCGGSHIFYTITQLCLLSSTVSWIILFVNQRRNNVFILR